MAHGMLERDKHQALSMAWHGLTEVVEGEHIQRESNWLHSWDVAPIGLNIEDVEWQAVRPNEAKPQVNWKTFIASDDGLPIGVPFDPESYLPIYNRQMLDAIYAFADGVFARVVSCGSFGNRSKVYAVLSLEKLKDIVLPDGKVVKPYVNAFWSHDKSLEVHLINSGIVTVCQNTFNANMALGKDAVKLRVKHTKGQAVKVENLDELIEDSLDVASAMGEMMVKLSHVTVDVETVRFMFAGFMTRNKLSTRGERSVDRLVELFQRGAGNNGKTLLDAFQAITDYYSHESAGGENKWKQFVSSEFGAASNLKAAFARLVTDEEKRSKLIALGQASLLERAKA